MQGQESFRGYIVTLPDGLAGSESARVALRAEDGGEYLITPKGMGLDLAEHINAKVEVTGSVQRGEEAVFLTVRGYRVEDAFEDGWYDDDGR